MISVVKDEFENIKAYVEWNRVNENGQFDNIGNYIYIADMFIHPSLRDGDTLWRLIEAIDNHLFSFNVDYVYWKRERHNDRLRIYKRKYFTRRIENVFKKTVSASGASSSS